MKIKNTIRYYIQRACSVRSLTLFVIWVYMLDILLQSFRSLAYAYGVKDACTVLPFVQTDGYFLKVMLIGVLCFFSNAPFMNHNEMYVILRTGRTGWGKRNIGYIFFSSAVLAVLLIAVSVCMILPVTDFRTDWGALYKTLSVHGESLKFRILDEAMQSCKPVVLLGRIFAVDSLAFAFLGMLLYTMSLCIPRIWAYFTVLVLIFLPTLEEFIPWSIVYWSPFSWIDPKKWRYGTTLAQPDFTYILTAYLFLLFLLVLAAQKRAETADWTENEED